ncbi:FecR family protein [Fulvivirgaceae bacterium BMA10]|uniref:FecR family protein n=1 Tax=Splendidivirga corallicola TaxID=3051826 RepID=A0ABT8KU17_9BACT|nr:FecR family protein [Fulvivirgaceae bacterium BMA10]
MKYEEYTVDDFIQDEFFIDWVREQSIQANYFWEKWVKTHPHKKDEVALAREIIISLNYERRFKFPEADSNEVLENLLRANNKLEGTSSGKRNRFMLIKRIAAIIVLTTFAAFSFHYFNGSGNNVASLNYTTKSGKGKFSSTFKLEDGSVVKLRGDSYVKIPEKFSNDKREIFLVGEAYFDIAEDKSKPFHIYTGDVTTKVTGTSFGINCDTLLNKVQVMLVSGEVIVNDIYGNSIKLKPNESVVYHNNRIFKENFNYDISLGWTEGKLVFEEAEEKEVMHRLEAWYNVKFILPDGYFFKGKYNGRFKNENLSNVLDGINFTSQKFNYEIREREIIITH